MSQPGYAFKRQFELSIMLEKSPNKPWAIALRERVTDCLSVAEMIEEGLGYDDIALIMEASGKQFRREHVKAIAQRMRST